jgi:hypothetical protein
METEQYTAEKQWVTEVIGEEIKKFLESNENENTTLPESVGHSKGHDK